MTDKEPLSVLQYERMADDLQKISDLIRAHPEMNPHFAVQLALIIKDMREDIAGVYPEILRACEVFAHSADTTALNVVIKT